MKNKCRLAIIVAFIVASFTLLIACQDTSPKYKVYFDTQGGSSVAAYSLNAGDTIQKPADPTRTMYTFDNWYTADGERFAFGGSMPEHDITLYAHWTADSWVTVTYDANGGKFDNNTAQTTQLCKVGSSLNLIGEKPKRAGYVFNGWYTAEQGGVEFGAGEYPVESFTLYAAWGADSAYAYVSYFGNGKLLEVMPIAKGEAVLPYSFDEDIVVGDYYTNSAMTAKYTFGQTANENLNLYTTYYTDGLTFSGNDVVSYTGKSSVVYVPSMYDGKLITSIGNQAFYRSTEYAEQYGQITEVVLPDTITAISSGAFQDCTYLTKINLTSSLKTIGDNAFWNAARLKDLGTISGATSIGDGAFSGCKQLYAVELSQSLTNLGDKAFADCSNIREIVIPNGVTSIGEYTFYGCTLLRRVVISANNLTSIGERAFYNCKSLTSVTIYSNSELLPIFDTHKEGNLRYSPFWGCPGSLVISVPASLVNSYKNAYATLDNGSLSNKFTAIR